MSGERELAKQYDPTQVEDRLYAHWENSGYFTAQTDAGKEPYTIVMPPPNITGQLHMGHALDITVQDCLIRFKRMQGYAALWVPGTDHASIATEVVVQKQLADEGLTKADLGREGFLKRAWEWKAEYGGRIVKQLRRLGASCDWSRECFTMDEPRSVAVREVFVRLYEEGLIYRGDRIINWCPVCHTAISDAEVEHEEREGRLWHIRYPLQGGGSLVIATTRPETMLGDTAVAVHPDDERYRALVGKTLELPLTGRTIPIVADAYVEREFGTGAVKVTPAHDPNDFEIGLRHNLPVMRIMDDSARISGSNTEFDGLDRLEARRRIVEKLEKQGLLVKTDAHQHSVGQCYRCDTAVEPIVSLQWFVRMKPLAEPAIAAVEEGDVRFVPQRFEKIYFNWMQNIRDWCISRQLWWGHRIPAWYCACGHMVVSREEPEKCDKCGGALRQDEDVLDTWFSSALWPFSTLGWPDNTPDLEYFYPTSVLVTAYDIIFFWVARMIFSGLAHTGKAPFRDVLIHGIVRDAQGRKMSKSLGNGRDPLELIELYGADALRFSLAMGSAPAGDMRLMEEKIESARNFANKLWNASRFLQMNLTEGEELPDIADIEPELEMADRWILTKLAQAAAEMTDNLERYELGLAASRIYDFFWSDYCDWYIELSKARLQGADGAGARRARAVLVYVLERALALLHPFMPFITEELYLALPGRREGETIMTAQWPAPDWDYSKHTADMERIMDAIRAIRNLRTQMGVQPGRRTQVMLIDPKLDSEALASAGQAMARLAYATRVSVVPIEEVPEDAASVISTLCEMRIPLEELVDVEKERERLQKEYDKLAGEAARAQGKLGNAGFTDKAPPHVVQQERDKLERTNAMLEAVGERLRALASRR